jgi:hypothetical protein
MKTISIVALFFSLVAAQQACQKFSADLNPCVVRVKDYVEPADSNQKACLDNNAPAATNKKCKGSPDDLKCMCANLDAIQEQSSECTMNCILKKGVELDLVKESERRAALCACVEKSP